jgi:cytochrome c-type biogenesis protein CcmH/NrfF
MAGTGFGYETTVKVATHEEGRLLFARPPTLRERLLEWVLPLLWLLVMGVVVAALFWL